MVTRAEKENSVVELHKQGEGSKEIARKVHMSFSDIGKILQKNFPQEYPEKTSVLSIETQALKLFSEGKTLVEVAMQLDAKPEDVMEMHKSYLRLEFRHTGVKILEEYKSQPKSLLRLLLVVKRSKLGLEGAAAALKSKDDILNAKKELAAINVQIGQKMNEYASLVLRGIPNVRSYTSRVQRSLVRDGSYYNYCYLPEEMV